MDEYKKGKEWLALTSIWRSIPEDVKQNNLEYFRVLSEFIKNQYVSENAMSPKERKEVSKDNYSYLNSLSDGARNLVIDLVNDGDKNLYHSIMAIIESRRGEFTSVNQLWEYYSGRFGKERSYIYTYEDEIKEIMELCLIRMDRKGINSLPK